MKHASYRTLCVGGWKDW